MTELTKADLRHFYRPIVAYDVNGRFLRVPFVAPHGYEWRWESGGDAGTNDGNEEIYEALDGMAWTCHLREVTSI